MLLGMDAWRSREGPLLYAHRGAPFEQPENSLEGFAAAKDSLKETILQQKRNAALTAYMAHLKQRAQREGTLEVRTEALVPG